MPNILPYGVPWILFPFYFINYIIRLFWKFLIWYPTRVIRNKYRKIKPVKRNSNHTSKKQLKKKKKSKTKKNKSKKTNTKSSRVKK